MRVSRTRGKKVETTNVPGGAKAAEGRVNDTGFSKSLKRAHDAQVAEEINQMIAEIDTAAALLRNRPSIRNLKEYKEKVGRFISRLIRYTYRVDEKLGIAGGRRRIYILVKRVDEKLEQLTLQVISGQSSTLALVGLLDEIRGILLDMYG